MKQLLGALLFSILGVSITSHAAGIYIEPGITYEFGDSKLQWPPPLDDSTGDIKGFGLNMKLGFHAADIFFAGVDASYSKPRFKNSANDYDADSTSTLFGAIVGLQAPIAGLRFWGGYIFDGVMDPEEDNGTDVRFSGANGIKVGLGFKIYYFSINAEYMDLTYRDSKLEKAGPISGDLNSDFKNKVGVVSLSFPFTL